MTQPKQEIQSQAEQIEVTVTVRDQLKEIRDVEIFIFSHTQMI